MICKRAVCAWTAKEVTKTEDSLAIYGEEQIRKALDIGAIDTLLLSENLRKYRIRFKCPSCNFSNEITLSEEEIEISDPIECKKCNTLNKIEIDKKIDIIDELSDLAEKTGCKVNLISMDSEEGDSLYSAFGGVAGISRYPLEF